MCHVPFNTITKHITNMHLYTILLTLIQIKINEKGYILTRTTVSQSTTRLYILLRLYNWFKFTKLQARTVN